VGLFRKKETYNEQMLREAGLDRVVFNTPGPEVLPTGPAPAIDLSTPPLEGSPPPPRDWDATTTVMASGIGGDVVRFTALPNGDLIVTEEDGNGDLSPFADAIEEHMSPPYEAIASRQDGDLWGAGAKQIEVEAFTFAGGDAIEVAQNDGVTELRVDGELSDAAVPATLQLLGERVGADFCVRALRIDGDYWAVKARPL